MFFKNNTLKKPNTYIKTITFSKQEFFVMNQRICKEYDSNKKLHNHFKTFYLWSVFASILGIFSGRGDFESTKIFLDCIKANYLPKITIAKNKDITKICITINEKELNERKSNKNTS